MFDAHGYMYTFIYVATGATRGRRERRAGAVRHHRRRSITRYGRGYKGRGGAEEERIGVHMQIEDGDDGEEWADGKRTAKKGKLR